LYESIISITEITVTYNDSLNKQYYTLHRIEIKECDIINHIVLLVINNVNGGLSFEKLLRYISTQKQLVLTLRIKYEIQFLNFDRSKPEL